ncbi:MAG: hypothetical protein Q8L14_42505 [Myxococcales bacterium]|nr:hypothetical protein [Myxococcales bacterium]
MKSTPRSDGRVDAEVELVCGCVITRALDENRLIVTDDGAQLVVGKYPCPKGHPVVRPLPDESKPRNDE